MNNSKTNALGRWAPLLLLQLLLQLLTACQSYPPSAPVVARMAAPGPSAQCIEQMQTAARRAGSERVVLTRAAFATQDRLSIVPSDTVVDAAGQPANERLRGLPDSFRLTLNTGVCTMVREADGRATTLPACSCVAMQ